MSEGLDGVIVGDSTTSLVNGVEGKLIYSGYHIEDLAVNALFEEVAFLLWNNRLPNQAELDELDRKSTRLNSRHSDRARMPSSA